MVNKMSAEKHVDQCIMGDTGVKLVEHHIPEVMAGQQLTVSLERQQPRVIETAPIYSTLLIHTPLQFPHSLNKQYNGSNSTSKAEPTFICDHCSKIFRRKVTLRAHLDTHSGTRVECSLCHQLLKTKKTLQRHMLVHNVRKLYRCPECNFFTRRKQGLIRHQIRMHTKIARYKCNLCPKKFKYEGDLKRHHENKHTFKPRIRDLRGKYVQHAPSLEKHHSITHISSNSVDNERIESNQNVAVECPSQSSDQEKLFNCTKCKWRFSSLNSLNNHMQRHLLTFKCDVCGVVFKYKASFLKHQESHKQPEQP